MPFPSWIPFADKYVVDKVKFRITQLDVNILNPNYYVFDVDVDEHSKTVKIVTPRINNLILGLRLSFDYNGRSFYKTTINAKITEP